MATGAPSSKKLAATAYNNKMAATAHNTKMAAGGHQNKMSSSVLLQQIQTLSDLQNSGVVHHADPAAQVRNKKKRVFHHQCLLGTGGGTFSLTCWWQFFENKMSDADSVP